VVGLADNDFIAGRDGPTEPKRSRKVGKEGRRAAPKDDILGRGGVDERRWVNTEQPSANRARTRPAALEKTHQRL
jgi:hypothetical protein